MGPSGTPTCAGGAGLGPGSAPLCAVVSSDRVIFPSVADHV
jgi:hypothetical protein